MNFSRLLPLLLLVSVPGDSLLAQTTPRCHGSGQLCATCHRTPPQAQPAQQAARGRDAGWVPLQQLEQVRALTDKRLDRIDRDVRQIAGQGNALAEKDQQQDELLAWLKEEARIQAQNIETLGRLQQESAKSVAELDRQLKGVATMSGHHFEQIRGNMAALQKQLRGDLSSMEQALQTLQERQSETLTAINASPSRGGAAKTESSHARHQQFSPLTGRLRATLIHGAPLALSVAEFVGVGVTTGGVGLLALPVARWGLGLIGSVMLGGLFGKRRPEEGRRDQPFPIVEQRPAGPYLPYETGRIRSADGGPVVDRFAGLVR